MRYIDCFSGTGSMTLALHEMLGELVAYCEIDASARAILHHNMQSQRLPLAPIVNDVASIKSAMFPGGVDAITASWPCVGHSSMGLKEGLGNVQSQLFHEVMRLCDEFDIKMMFLENVRALLTNGGSTVLSAIAAKGYDIRYAVIPAYAVGSPQHRERWFCIAIKPHVKLVTSYLHPQQTFCWREDEHAIPRMVHARGEERRKALMRSAILGNALVPDQIQLAFVFLITGQVDVFGKIFAGEFQQLDKSCPVKGNSLPVHAHMVGGQLYKLPSPKFQPPNLSLELVASNYTWINTPNPAISSALLTSKKMRAWSTPRKTMTGACNVLTARSSKDLPTQLRFERCTPASMVDGIMNPCWVEYLMGFPSGWTDF